MDIALMTSGTEILSGLFVGILFGFLLRKAHVTRFAVIVGQLLLRDFTVMKVMMTAVILGSAAVYALHSFDPGLVLEISSTTLASAVLGGAIFGFGMAILGFCPGTAVGALGDGAKDMRWGLLGMIVGAGLYAEAFPWIQAHIKPSSALVKTTLPEYFGISPWVIISALGAVGVFYLAFTRWKKKPSVQT